VTSATGWVENQVVKQHDPHARSLDESRPDDFTVMTWHRERLVACTQGWTSHPGRCLVLIKERAVIPRLIQQRQL
jgi:hypothetical protein